MQTRAAILYEVGADWSVEDIELDEPKAGEVKVKLAGLGLALKDSPPGFDPGAAVYFDDEDEEVEGEDFAFPEDEKL